MQSQEDEEPDPVVVIGADFVVWTTGAFACAAMVFAGGLRWSFAGLLGWIGTSLLSRRAAWWIVRRMGWLARSQGRPD